jgi:hypothetical protein
MSVNSKMTAIADAIRLKTGKTDRLTLDEMASAIVNISGDTDIEDSLVKCNLSIYSNDRVSTIGSAAFNSNTYLTSVAFSKCRYIGWNAFDHCTHLVNINFPQVTTIDRGAFAYCTSLTSIDFPQCSTVSWTAFDNCSRLTNANFPKCTLVSSSAFRNCKMLSNVNFPVCISIGYGAFSSTGLISASFPACQEVSSYGFAMCSSLQTITLPVCTTIYSYAFSQCTKLSSVYLPGSSLCSLLNSKAFYRAGITSSTGAIYVPLSLGWNYKNATNWAYFSNVIFSIEGDEIVDPDNPTPDEPSGKIITITIDIDTYEAEEGMTWAEWVDSEYNTGGFINAGHVIVDSSMTSAVVDDEEFTEVLPDDVISEDVIYSTVYYSGILPEEPEI